MIDFHIDQIKQARWKRSSTLALLFQQLKQLQQLDFAQDVLGRARLCAQFLVLTALHRRRRVRQRARRRKRLHSITMLAMRDCLERDALQLQLARHQMRNTHSKLRWKIEL